MSSFDTTGDNARTLEIVGWIMLALSTVVVGLRTHIGISRLKKLNIADYLMLASLMSEVLHMILVSISRTHGLGRHFATLTPVQQQAALFYIAWFGESIVTCMLGRLSFAAFLLYIIGLTDPKKRFVLWLVIVVQVVITTITIIQIYTRCGTNVRALWNYEAASTAHCQNEDLQVLVGYIQCSLNSACDLILTILPAMVLWTLNMPLRQKLGLGACLTLSVFAFGASLLKAIAIRNLDVGGDPTWSIPALELWICVENSVVMIAASIPTLRPLFRKPAPKAYTYTHSSESRPKDAASRDPYSLPEDDKTVANDASSDTYPLESISSASDDLRITRTHEVHFEYETIDEAALQGHGILNAYQRHLIGPWEGPNCRARPSVVAMGSSP